MAEAKHAEASAYVPLAPVVLATVHPSSLLRAPDEGTRRREMKLFTDDLRKVQRALKL